jgi:hypothetical protein
VRIVARDYLTSGIRSSFTILVTWALILGSLAFPAPAIGTGSAVQSSVSVFLACPAISFSSPGASASCAAGNYTAVYSGISQTIGSTQNSLFYLASANGGVKVTFGLTDVTTGKLLISGVGYGSISGGTCSAPDLVIPTSFTTTANALNSGDTVKAALGVVFTGTGTPAFCSGGSASTLVSVGTTVALGSSQPLLTTTLTPGRARQTTLSGFTGIAESYKNTGSVSMTAIVVGVLKNFAGSTVDVLTTSVTASPNANVTAFLPFKQYSSGTYTVTIIAIASSDVPVSTVAQTTATV